MSYIKTCSGNIINYLDPQEDQIKIYDIARGLSREARFNGQTHKFYSVAEHCIRVSYWCKPEDALAGLLHDATEAYMKDIPSPLKMLIPDYKTIEARLHAVICRAFGISANMPDSVRDGDDHELHIDLKFRLNNNFSTAMSMEEAEDAFINRFLELT